MALHLNKLEWSLPNADFCYLWIKLAQWVWRRYKNFVIHVCYFFSLSPLGKEWGPSLKEIYIPYNQGCLVPNLGEIDPVGMETIFKFRQWIFAISLLTPQGKKREWPFIWATWIPFTHRCLVSSLVEIGTGEDEMWKDDNEQWTNFDRNSSLKPYILILLILSFQNHCNSVTVDRNNVYIS